MLTEDNGRPDSIEYALVKLDVAFQSLSSVTTPVHNVAQPDTRFNLAAEATDGFFKDVPNEAWLRKVDKFQNTALCAAGIDCAPELGRVWHQHNFEPSFVCGQELRIGRWGDGGKWICDPHRIPKNNCLVYSVGSNNDFSFETAVLDTISPHCEIHTFDPSVGTDPSNWPKSRGVHFHPWGISHTTEPDRHFFTMDDVVKKLGHQGRSIDIFKIDCEGCEYESFASWWSCDATLRQIQVEIHGRKTDQPIGKTTFKGLLQNVLTAVIGVLDLIGQCWPQENLFLGSSMFLMACMRLATPSSTRSPTSCSPGTLISTTVLSTH